jgi:hypothetical protein
MSSDLHNLIKDGLYTQAVLQVDKLLSSASSVEESIQLIHDKVFCLLKTKQIQQAFSTLSNTFGTSDLSEMKAFKNSLLPVKLRVLSCLIHHYNSDTFRSLNALYVLLANLTKEQGSASATESPLVLITISKIQHSLGDIEELQRILSLLPEQYRMIKEQFLHMNGLSDLGDPGIVAMTQGDYGKAIAMSSRKNAAISCVYAGDIRAGIETLESLIRDNPVENSTQEVVSNLCLMYDLLPNTLIDQHSTNYKKSTLREIGNLFAKEKGLVL